jgi:DNA-binding CsgD family transcriptional regulator/pimeloyl-ACP methyl ester carboxylesterase
MEPNIQYAITSDDVSIAFCTLGNGAPIVVAPSGPWSNIQLESQVPPWSSWHEKLAQSRTVVRYDSRGIGLSDQSASDFALDSQVRDLEAVIGRLGQASVALLGPEFSGPAAATYAVRHPDRVSHLILWCTYARATDYVDSPHMQALINQMNNDWDLSMLMIAHSRLDAGGGPAAHRLAGALGQTVTREAMEAFISGAQGADVTDLLQRVKSPTLVLHRRQAHLDVSVAKDLASRIPDARLVLLEGESAAPYLEDADAVLRAIYDFLGEEQNPPLIEGPPGWIPDFPIEPLSERELEVLHLLASGMPNQEIAERLVIGVGTVKTHVYRIFGKLGVKTRTQAAVKARELGLH